MHRTTRLPESLWAATAIAAPDYARAEGDRSCEIAIIGGGYTGLSAALHLAQAGRDVVVIEAAQPGWGASGRNGGQIIAGLRTNPEDLIATFGDDLGMRMIRRMGAAADVTFDLIARYGIECQARRSGWIYAAHGVTPLRDVVEQRRRQWAALGVAMEALDREQLAARAGSDPEAYVGGLRDPRGGVLQPLSYARGLARAAMQEGAVILAGAPAMSLRREGEGWAIAVAGHTIRAAQVILASNAYTSVFADRLYRGLHRTVIPVTSFQMATPPLTGEAAARILPGGEGVTDSRRLLTYFRRDHTGRLVMGGRSPVEDWPSKADAGLLQAAVARTFPALGRPSIDYVWAGKVAITKDKMPHIHMPEAGLIYFIGCNGRGVALCAVMGALLAELALGKAPADLDYPVSAPDQFALHGLRRLGVFALSRYYRLLDRMEAQTATAPRGG